MPSATVRDSLVNALRLDLVGPRPGDPEHASYEKERLPTAPSTWYLTGFLAPSTATANMPVNEVDESDPEAAVSGFDDDTPPERGSAKRAHFPSSIGLTVIVPQETRELVVEAAWGDYEAVFTTAPETAKGAARADEWRRLPRRESLRLPLDATDQPVPHPVPNGGGLEIVVHVRSVDGAHRLPPGARAVSVFLVNRREPAPDVRRDEAFVFQPALELHCEEGFIPRPDLRHNEDDLDERVADVQYRDAFEVAVGHNVSASAKADGNGRFRTARTDWMPVAEVEKVVPKAVPNAVLQLERLASATSAAELQDMLAPLILGYEKWISAQPVEFDDSDRATTAKKLMEDAGRALSRLREGLEALSDPLAFEAFRLTNRVMATAMRQRWSQENPGRDASEMSPPSWRPFQLAFVLLNLAGIVDPGHADRDQVDLLFFPTGGGKTEAYLGLAAFTMLLRRLRDPSRASAGVSVLMRYTLRLLTLDQLGRAATMICAMELLRQENEDRLGEWPFEIGLWVGQAATPNRLGSSSNRADEESAATRTRDYRRDPRGNRPPLPIGVCPWCGEPTARDSFALLPNDVSPEHLRVLCLNRSCAFHSRRQPMGLPLVAVDEEVYRRLPAFLISTVDKFASLPFVARTSGLFGRVDRFDSKGFLTPGDGTEGEPLPHGLPPPDLIIQDELHLISGPFGDHGGAVRDRSRSPRLEDR